MKKYSGHKIKSVDPGSIADQLELEPGDVLLTINGQEVEDIFDYQYKLNNDRVTVEVLKKNGEDWELDIENDYSDLGLNFENGLMSDYRSCSNDCVFCFIDQMPPGMRDTLYFKDDDSRLSFLQGNYVTLTNMSDHDLQRIITFHLAPINISVHTTNPELRCRMLHNRFAGEALKKIDTLYEADTPMNGQIVLCPGINDGEELERTIRDLTKYVPVMQSLSVVPVGVTKFRNGLYPLRCLTPEEAGRTIDQIERWQKKIYAEHGIHFVQASDEFYLLAGRPLPEAERYDGYIQLENGVGMLRLQHEEAASALEPLRDDGKKEKVTIATGLLAAPYIEKIAKAVMARFPGREIRVIPVKNRYFGSQITVSGLLTGQDIRDALLSLDLGNRLLLPCSMFRSGEEVFLDDMTRTELSDALGVRVDIVPEGGDSLVEAMLSPVRKNLPGENPYEPEDGGVPEPGENTGRRNPAE
ncbi:DUF512 domain-containing protein [Clostridium vitabionis]|uniref:DUF512 domain-containing protein n=1 Tax=Clostridium vitabionis TaxID=2784388 RepID=UPI00188A96E8|nr:DUF512 domain-containing protein [Clostridium vitabionis]